MRKGKEWDLKMIVVFGRKEGGRERGIGRGTGRGRSLRRGSIIPNSLLSNMSVGDMYVILG